jgi:Zn-dependent protease with chaperone function
MSLSRRTLLAQAGCACTGLLGLPAWARELSLDLTPVVTRDYRPAELDERGLWDQCNQLEDRLANSSMRINDAGLDAYLSGVLQRLLGDEIKNIRVFAMRNPDFNASMFPNGMMIVNSGLLARTRNEAQLAAVLGHESGHYLRRHSLQSMRNRRTTTGLMAFVAVGSGVVSGYTGTNWYDLANAINNGLLLSVFRYSRELESEADAYGLKLMSHAGYSPEAASQVWIQLIEERKASAKARKKKYSDGSASAFSTHPPTTDRMQDLSQTAIKARQRNVGASYDDGRTAFLDATVALRPSLIDEQVKLNDPGASLYLLNSLAQDGWDSALKFYEGETYRLRDEPGDAALASQSYAAAVQFADVLPEAYRAHGYAELKLGHGEAGKQALARYLELRPDASDADMVRFSLQQ